MPGTDIALDLIDILQRERIALCGGNFELLAALQVDKLRLTGLLPTQVIPSAQVTHIARTAERNRKLLVAAMTGLREGSDRAATIRSGARSFSSYDQNGLRSDVSSGTARDLERRA